MRIHVANCSKQVQIINYRLPEVASPRSQEVGLGRQEILGGDVTAPQFDALRVQFARYGFTDLSKVGDAPADMVIPLVFSTRPITSGDIQAVMRRNTEILEDRGKVIRRMAAVATAEHINQNMSGLRELSMSVEEDDQGSFTDRDPLAEGNKWVPDGRPAPEAPRRGRGRKAA